MKIVVGIILTALIVGIGAFVLRSSQITSPLGEEETPKELPFKKYEFENLKITKFQPSELTLGRVLDPESDEQEFVSQYFYYSFDPGLNSGQMASVSGQINVPQENGTYPVIVMFRGFVPQSAYSTGVGTNRGASYLARNGFITIAPDFLGYGESGEGAGGFENRFQTYITALTLLSSLDSLNSALDASYSGSIRADTNKIGIWAHSNGGQIALSSLAISGKSYPTVLWNPVTKPFPFSILFYTDEYDDDGKALRADLAAFEEDYDIERFSPHNFYHWITAPIQIHQGEKDIEVPFWWSDDFVESFEEMDKEIEYFSYPGADHNLMPTGWNTAIERSAKFFTDQFEENESD